MNIDLQAIRVKQYEKITMSNHTHGHTVNIESNRLNMSLNKRNRLKRS